MLKKGGSDGAHVDLLLEKVAIRSGSENVREAVKAYLVTGTSQADLAEEFGVQQSSISRLLKHLRDLNDWAIEVSKYNQ